MRPPIITLWLVNSNVHRVSFFAHHFKNDDKMHYSLFLSVNTERLNLYIEQKNIKYHL